MLMGQTTKKVRVENIYEQTPQFEANVRAFMTSGNLEEARPQLVQVCRCTLARTRYIADARSRLDPDVKVYGSLSELEVR